MKGGKISYHVFENTGCGDALRTSMPMQVLLYQTSVKEHSAHDGI